MSVFKLNRKSSKTLSDTELVSALKNGDQEAIVYFFYEKYAATFQYHIYKIFKHYVDFQALVDEFFIYLFEDDWKRLRSFDPQKSSLNTWVSTVSFRFFRDYRNSMRDLEDSDTIDNKGEAILGDWAQANDAEIVMDVTTAIEGLNNERDREIAKKLLFEDAEYEAVAAMFDINVGYVYTIKNRVLNSVKKVLTDYR